MSSSACSLVHEIGFISVRKHHCQTLRPDKGNWATHLDTAFILSISQNSTTNSSLVEDNHYYAFTNKTGWLKVTSFAKGQMN